MFSGTQGCLSCAPKANKHRRPCARFVCAFAGGVARLVWAFALDFSLAVGSTATSDAEILRTTLPSVDADLPASEFLYAFISSSAFALFFLYNVSYLPSTSASSRTPPQTTPAATFSVAHDLHIGVAAQP